MNSKRYCVYIGVTGDLVKRTYQHKNKLVKGFSSKYNLNKLVYFEIHDNPELAIKREKQIKNLLRRKKEDLINVFNLKWNDLYEELF